MKLIAALIASIGLLSAIAFVQAAPRGPNNGIQGTIATVGSNGFAITTKDGKTLNVLCSPNTKFMSGGEAADPSEIKVGVKVGVQGGMTSQTEVSANVVVILGSEKKKKT